jgi:hypothetical protein
MRASCGLCCWHTCDGYRTPLSIDVRMLLHATEGLFKVVQKPLRKATAFIAVELCRRIGFGQSVRVPLDRHAVYFALS